MTMTPTPTGYDLLYATRPRPAHRAVMTAERSAKNLGTLAGFVPQPHHGAHYAPLTGAAAWLAEEAAQEREILRVPR